MVRLVRERLISHGHSRMKKLRILGHFRTETIFEKSLLSSEANKVSHALSSPIHQVRTRYFFFVLVMNNIKGSCSQWNKDTVLNEAGSLFFSKAFGMKIHVDI